jgi:hypothetical protein
VVGEALTPLSLGVLGVFHSFIVFSIALEVELEELCCRLGQSLNFVGDHSYSLVERFDNVPCRIRGVVGFDVRQGAAVTPLVGELQSSCSLWEVVGPPSTLLDEGRRRCWSVLMRRQFASYIIYLWTTLFVALIDPML